MVPLLELPDHVVHSAYGLRFRSRLAWLPLRRVDDATSAFDVDVTFGAVPEGLGDGAFKTPRFDAEPGRLLFRTRTIADYLVEDGRRVRVQPKAEADQLRLCNLLFGAATGGLLIQRGTLALHGCSVQTPAGAVLFCGGSGAGKSTLSTLLLDQGFRVLDDNIAALEVRDGRFLVQPGLGYLRLTGHSLELLGKRPQGPGFPSPVTPKFLHPLPPDLFCDQARRLRHIFVLDRSCPVLVSPIRGSDRLAAVRRFTFMGQMVEGLGRLQDHFRLWLALAGSVPLSTLGHPPEVDVTSWSHEIAGLLRGTWPRPVAVSADERGER